MSTRYAIHNFESDADGWDESEAQDHDDGDFAVVDTVRSTIGYFVVAACDEYWKAKMIRDALNALYNGAVLLPEMAAALEDFGVPENSF